MKRLYCAMNSSESTIVGRMMCRKRSLKIQTSLFSASPADGKCSSYPNGSGMPYTEKSSCSISANQNTGIDWPKNAKVVMM